MKKMNKNLKMLLFIISFCIIIFYMCYFFLKNIINDNKEILTILIPLLGTLIAGVLTMFGVCWTLISNNNKTINDEKLYIVREAKILKADINSYAAGILNFNQSMVWERINSTLITSEFDNYCKAKFINGNVIFMSDGIKERFYKLLSYDMDEDVLAIFVRFYNYYEKFKEYYYKEDLSISNEVLFRSGYLVLNINFLNNRFSIFDTYKMNENRMISNNINNIHIVLNEFEQRNIQNYRLSIEGITDLYSSELKKIIEYLDNIINKYSN